ncbi:F0F1 ATP synthase subunit gamma [Apilactobacillus timberlakei]|uniref:ATP synthase gamma chain n=1 Tax=Apilactobacillus timberlakei TaxID=2008380 RepID=A0ABY2YS15_9LACO|nr:F0F1 ATP synthase subunit gamma [Apilactobacillus timberlakei]TPR12643.1 F0F1 ATP synthase subunit gamma [Apilactobacillus timberlakei]TPR13472.1 F0F1 ATP synthase subunit gamma [Apilactobacillus timberlakei]TPR15545.1 F0F1 ATP synthase subunit gamma [Apilactobacillus timberlakei]TPR17793.1 F0F1 ATP synthase subunit gamma [Apilactobacillus timberlakei]TPR18494.1 F0F1 ATP synthase subunit gamma [Apilactobacillus timberlakei]
MAESINEVKHRIASTKSTHQITTAMQMVSTAKLNRIQKHSVSYEQYVSRVKSVVMHLAQSHLLDNINSSSNADSGKAKKTAYLVITSDRGMVGSYNSNVIREANAFIDKNTPNPDDYMILAVGGNGADFYKNRNVNVAYEYRGVSDIPTFAEVREIVKTANSMYEDGVFDELYVCYTHFINRISSEFRAEKMLPMDSEAMNEGASKDVKTSKISAEYEVEPDKQAVLKSILPQYAQSLVFGAILDAKTSEHSASSSAMQSASDNAEDLISKLELQYNRARQAAITTEITEIVGGQEALKH